MLSAVPCTGQIYVLQVGAGMAPTLQLQCGYMILQDCGLYNFLSLKMRFCAGRSVGVCGLYECAENMRENSVDCMLVAMHLFRRH